MRRHEAGRTGPLISLSAPALKPRPSAARDATSRLSLAGASPAPAPTSCRGRRPPGRPGGRNTAQMSPHGSIVAPSLETGAPARPARWCAERAADRPQLLPLGHLGCHPREASGHPPRPPPQRRGSLGCVPHPPPCPTPAVRVGHRKANGSRALSPPCPPCLNVPVCLTRFPNLLWSAAPTPPRPRPVPSFLCVRTYWDTKTLGHAIEIVGFFVSQ